VKYAIEATQSGGSIQVLTQAGQAGVEVRILDSGPGMGVDSEEGIGISNVRERLGSAIEGASLTFSPRPEGGLEALIVLPHAGQGIKASE